MTELVTIDWLDTTKQTVLVTYNKDGWTWNDFFMVVDKQYNLVASVDYTVDVMVDVRKTHWLPRGGSLSSGVRKINNSHPRQGLTVIVGAKGLIAVVANSLMKLLGERQKFHFVQTMDEANALLQKHRQQRASRV